MILLTLNYVIQFIVKLLTLFCKTLFILRILMLIYIYQLILSQPNEILEKQPCLQLLRGDFD